MTTYYTPSHEWVRLSGNIATVGITQHASEALGELVFAESKDEGTELSQGDTAAIVESVKAASDIYAPISGVLHSFNEKLSTDPTLIGADPEGEGWIFKLKISDSSQLEDLMNEESYRASV